MPVPALDPGGARRIASERMTDRTAARGEFSGSLVRIAVPIALQNFISSGVSMLGTVMVGRLGEAPLAAVGLGNQVYFLLLLFIFGITTGGGVFTAQYWGRKDLAGIRRTVGLSLAAGLGTALVFTLVSAAAPAAVIGIYSRDPEVVALGARYLRISALAFLPMAASFVLGLSMRSVEKVRLPLVATLLSLGLNAALGWVLIFGKFGLPAMGVEGAAWAVVASRVLELAVLWAVSYARRYPTAGSLRELARRDALSLSRYLAIALPVIANEVTWSLGITTYNAIFARAGTAHLAAYNVANTVGQLAMVLFLGTANAAAVMIGKKIGEGDTDTARLWARRFAMMAPALGLAVGLLLLPVRLAVPWLFRLDAGTMAQVSAMLVVLGLAFPFKVFNLHVIVGICRAGGDTRFGFWYDLGGIWGLGVPLAALGAFVLGLPAWGIFLMTMTDELGKAGFGLWRLLSGKWLRRVIA